MNRRSFLALSGLTFAGAAGRVVAQSGSRQTTVETTLGKIRGYMDEGVQILELARNAQRLFERQEPRQKRRLLNFVLSNCTWEDGEVIATFRQPFDLLAEIAVRAARAAVVETTKSSKTEIWLGD